MLVRCAGHPVVTFDTAGEGIQSCSDILDVVEREVGHLPEAGDIHALEKVFELRPDAMDLLQVVVGDWRIAPSAGCNLCDLGDSNILVR